MRPAEQYPAQQVFQLWNAAIAVLVLCLLSCPILAQASEDEPQWESKGEIALEGRVFENDDTASTKDGGAALGARVETKRFSETLDFKGRIFGRVDQLDTSRSQVILEEAWAGAKTGDFSLRLGAQMLNWTATEAFHPADIINSRNLDSNVENPEKIGEPMALVAWNHDGWTVQGLFMPAQMDPYLPSASSRLSFSPPGVSIGEALWLDRDGGVNSRSLAAQWGARVARSFESADLALHFVQHQDRSQPAIGMDPATGVIHPIYLPVTQIGGTYQQALGGVMLKLEAAHRRFELPSGTTPYGPIQRSNHSLVAVGLEYGWAYESGSESTVLLEGQALLGVGGYERRSLTPFQQDLLLGFRHAFNDEMGRELMASVIWDTERTAEHLLSLSYAQRLSDTWSIKLSARRIHAPAQDALPVGMQALDGANQLGMAITRHF